MRKSSSWLLGLFVFLLQVQSVFAHSVGVSRGSYEANGKEILAELIFSRHELLSSFPDRNYRSIVETLEVWNSSQRCVGTLQHANPTDQDGFLIRAVYRCDTRLDAVTLNLGFLEHLNRGHRHLITAVAGNENQHGVSYAGSESFRFSVTAAKSLQADVAWPFFQLGIFHIWTGYDHLVFLVGLILVGGRLRSLVTVITAFTAGHSLTLCAAVLGIWVPPPLYVEPAIALSIAYIGLENWFVKSADRRWMITFPFGLIHGFGFAGVLEELSIPGSQVPVALGAFNLGVEAGQIVFLLVVLPLVLFLRRRAWFASTGVRMASTAIAMAGVSWFVFRLR